MSFLGAEELLPPQCLLLAKERAPDPDNVFGAAACGHPRVEVRRCSRRERVNSDPRDPRTEGRILQNSGVRLLTREAINGFGGGRHRGAVMRLRASNTLRPIGPCQPGIRRCE